MVWLLQLTFFVHINKVIHLTKLPLSSSWLEVGCGLVDNLQTTVHTVRCTRCHTARELLAKTTTLEVGAHV